MIEGLRMRIAAGVAAIAMLGATGIARADDSGIFSFFQQQFGGGGGGDIESYPQRTPQPSLDDPDDGYTYESRPLTVRRHRRPAVARAPVRSPKEVALAIKDVTIYTDKTLARGDAVMTRNGLRIFNGSSSLPHTDDDFVAVSSVQRLSPDLRKELHSIDVASRVAANGY